MILGLGRPSLRPQPSLLDLVHRKKGASVSIVDACSALLKQHQEDRTPPDSFDTNIDIDITTSTNNDSNISNDPDTEDSYSVDSSDIESISSLSSSHIETRSPPVMAPKNSKPAEAGDEQKGVVFSISGPVIVAENMIGCAMYEMVG